MHIMNRDLASEVSTAAQTASSGSNSTASPVDAVVLDQRSNRADPATAESGETADTADSSSRSLKLRKAFSRPRGSFFGSIRSSIRSSFASGNLSDDDSLEAEHHGSDDLQQRSSGRRRRSMLKKRFSMSRRSSTFSRSSIGISGTGGGRSKRSHVNRKSSLDLIRGSEGQYRPRAEHPLLTDHPSAEDKTQRRGSFLGVAMRKLSMNGSARNSFRRTKSSGNLASRARPSASPLSSSDHPPPRKGSFFGSFRRGSDGEAFRMNLSNHV